MKKRWYINNILLVVFIFLFIICLGATYSFFQVSINSASFNSSSATLAIDYIGDVNINEVLPLGTSKEDGILRTNKARLASNSMNANLGLYLKLDVFPQEFASEGVKYEIWINDETSARKVGNLKDAKQGDMVKIFDNLELTHSYQTIKVYLWIDGNLVTNELMNKAFAGSIVTSTGNITGVISK